MPRVPCSRLRVRYRCRTQIPARADQTVSLAAVVHPIGATIFSLTAQGAITLCNRVAARLLGDKTRASLRDRAALVIHSRPPRHAPQHDSGRAPNPQRAHERPMIARQRDRLACACRTAYPIGADGPS